MTILKIYDYLMNELSDPRVQNWTMFSTPIPILLMIVTYLATIYIFLPAFMKHRAPFNLKTTIICYNLFQIAACMFLIYGISTSGWTTHYTLGCQTIDYSDNPLAVRMLHFIYYTFLLKVMELIETVFFILRKKYGQVSTLHVYHHTSTVLLGWLGVKYVAGGMATFPVIINCFIHIIMYSYYLLSSLGPKWQKKVSKWKPKITASQLIQFCIIVVHATQALSPSCHVPKYFLLIYFPNIALNFNMFWNFYKANYINKHKET